MRTAPSPGTARQAIAAAGTAGALALSLAACGGDAPSSSPAATASPPSASMPTQAPSTTPMPGTSGMPTGNGLAARLNGYTPTALSASGNRRLFLQFQTAGTLHTAAVTVHVS